MPEAPADGVSQPGGLRAIPRGVWALGLVSLFMDMSSELVHSLLPVFVVSMLGASPLTLGLIEGVAEATASISKVFSGLLSDYLGKRKLLAVIGYSMAALTKPLFPLASSVELVIVARFIDRIGKGIRGAPRDALVADIAPPHLRGACHTIANEMDEVPVQGMHSVEVRDGKGRVGSASVELRYRRVHVLPPIGKQKALSRPHAHRDPRQGAHGTPRSASD